jgi:DNA-binding beta-propeller fold protein YncE
VVLGTLFFGCESKFPMSSLPSASASRTIGDTVYVQQNPVWTGFNNPTAIIVGNEPFIYVADTYNDRIVMLDLTGREIGIGSDPSPSGMRRPIGIAQDKKLNLIVCAEFDTTLPGHTSPTTFGAVYKMDLVSVGHDISAGVFKRVFFEPSDSARRYTAVATLFDNTYYVGRTGPDDSGIDKDDNILLFSGDDHLLTGLPPYFTWDGTGLLSIHKVTGIATLPNKRTVEYVFSQTGATSLFKVQWIQLVVVGQTTDYESKFYPDVDLYSLGKFQSPRGVTFDPAGNLFVVDAQTDSLYRFSSSGAEHYSFGGTGSGDRQFRQPSGVAYFDKTIYVADAGNNRILRFKLSTELN